jgi:membrane protein implicated in regulation of membrane protease activity
MMITAEDVKLWAGLAMAAAGALALLGFWFAVVAGIAVRLYRLASGSAQFARKPGRGKRRRTQALMNGDGERVPLGVLLDGGAGADTAPLPVVVARDD